MSKIEIALFVLAFVGLHQYAGWILIIMAVPIFGVFLYMMVGLNGYTRWMEKRYRKVDEELIPLLREDTKAEESLWEADPSGATLSNYLKKQAGYPLCEGTEVIYYRSLYHHFENGCVLYQNEAVMDIRKDFEEMYAVSNEVTLEYSVGKSRFLRLWQLWLRIMAPLL